MTASIVSHGHNSSTTVAQPPSQPAVNPRGSVYDIITDRIIKQLESGVAPWRKPWSAKLPVDLISQKPYRGLNVLTLASQGYPSRFWLTFNQANKLGGQTRKGEHSSPVIYWNIGEEREYTTRDGETRVSKPFLLRYSNVFNLSQTEGINLPASALQETRTNNPIEDCERIVSGMPNRPTLEQSDKAWYSPSRDVVYPRQAGAGRGRGCGMNTLLFVIALLSIWTPKPETPRITVGDRIREEQRERVARLGAGS